MSTAPSAPLLRQIRHLIASGQYARLSDGELLERFVATGEEAAFEALVRRYGPLVLGACRRVLRDGHAAEDVFQATFLVLVRKAASLDRRQPLGGWLYTVAYRLALRARGTTLRQRSGEAQAAQRRPVAEASAEPSELAVALEEELLRLPEKHRAPLVLCYLEGKTNEQAAEQLGCPKGSMSWRLAQARELLRERLAQRGYGGPAAVLGALLAAQSAPAAVPMALVRSTVDAGLWFAAASSTPAGVVSAQALNLAQGALRTMFPSPLKFVAGMLLTVGLFGGMTVLGVADAQGPAAPPPAVPPAAARPEAPPAPVVARLGSSRLRHGDGIFYAAYTPDGKALLTASNDQTIRLWDVATGRELRRFDRGPAEPGDGPAKMMAVGGKGVAMRMASPVAGFAAALASDGRTVAATRGSKVIVWETATGKKLHELKSTQPGLTALGFAADGRTLAALGIDRSLTLWETASGKVLKAPAPADGPATLTNAASAALSPDLKHLAVQNFDLGTQSFSLKIVEVATGRDVQEIQAPVGGAQVLAFSPDGKTLAMGSGPGGIQLYDVATGKELRSLGGKHAEGPANALAFSPDGKTLALSREGGTLELWNVATGQQTHKIGESAPRPGRMVIVRVAGMAGPAGPALAFAPDGERLAASLGGTGIRQFDVATGKEIAPPDVGHSAAVSELAIGSDGRTLLTHGRGDPVRVWDLATGKAARTIALPAGTSLVTTSADGQWLAAVRPGTVALLETKTGQEARKVEVGEGGVAGVALSPDGKVLATRDPMSPDIRLWDTATGKELRVIAPPTEQGRGNGVVVVRSSGVVTPGLAFSPDGRLLAGAGGKRQLCLWDVASGEQVWEAAAPQDASVERFAFSPDGRSVATRNADGTVILYETATGERRAHFGKPEKASAAGTFTVSFGGVAMPLLEGQAPAAGLAFSPTGRHLAVAEAARPGVRIWDLLSGEEVGRCEGHEGGVVSLRFTPDGQRLVSGSKDTTALVWDVTRLARPSSPARDRLDEKSLEALWEDLQDRDAEKAFTAIRKLASHPAAAAKLLGHRLTPAAAGDPKRVAALIADLESDEFEVRRKAESELERLGDRAEEELRKVLRGEPSLELRQRAERLLRKVSGVTLVGPALRERRAIEVLEALGAEGRPVLERLAKGAAGARLTREAEAALGRMR